MSSLCRFTLLHAPNDMKVKNALAVKAVLELCDRVGDHLEENWKDALWCVSRWELLYQSQSGGPTDASLFADAREVSECNPYKDPNHYVPEIFAVYLAGL